MKALFIAPALLMFALLIGGCNVSAKALNGTEGNEATVSTTAPVMASRLEYRFFENTSKKNYFTLALERTPTEPATVKILTEDGLQVYRASIESTTLVRHFDMRPLLPGRYTLQITSGSQVREEVITID